MQDPVDARASMIASEIMSRPLVGSALRMDRSPGIDQRTGSPMADWMARRRL